MDKNAVLFALNRFFDIVENRTGRGVDQVVVKTFEANRDFLGIRLDGVKCYTKQGLLGVIERIYQKEENLVRCEDKITRHMTVDEFTALIHGGVSSYNLHQGLFMLSQRVEKLVVAIKFQNGLISRLLKLECARLERVS